MDYSLSGENINNALNNKSYTITYKELFEFKNIDDLLKLAKYIIILYETTENYGHWCALFKNNKDSIEFFDSYGIMPDDELKFSKKVFRKSHGFDFPHLTSLLIDCPYNIEYNDHKFQKKGPNVATCGRWCILRCLLSDFDIDKFYLLFKKYKNKDKLAVFLTKEINK